MSNIHEVKQARRVKRRAQDKLKREIYLKAAELIESGRANYSCFAVEDAVDLILGAGRLEEARRLRYSWLGRLQRLLANDAYACLEAQLERDLPGMFPLYQTVELLRDVRSKLLRAAANRHSLRDVWDKFIESEREKYYVQGR